MPRASRIKRKKQPSVCLPGKTSNASGQGIVSLITLCTGVSLLTEIGGRRGGEEVTDLSLCLSQQLSDLPCAAGPTQPLHLGIWLSGCSGLQACGPREVELSKCRQWVCSVLAGVLRGRVGGSTERGQPTSASSAGKGATGVTVGMVELSEEGRSEGRGRSCYPACRVNLGSSLGTDKGRQE